METQEKFLAREGMTISQVNDGIEKLHNEISTLKSQICHVTTQSNETNLKNETFKLEIEHHITELKLLRTKLNEATSKVEYWTERYEKSDAKNDALRDVIDLLSDKLKGN